MIEANLIGEVPHIIKINNGVIGFLGERKEEILFHYDYQK
jgi:hypothetical protein